MGAKVIVAEVTSAAISAAEVEEKASASVPTAGAAAKAASADSARAAVFAAAALAVDVTESQRDVPAPANPTETADMVQEVEHATTAVDPLVCVETSGSKIFGSSKTESEVFGAAS